MFDNHATNAFLVESDFYADTVNAAASIPNKYVMISFMNDDVVIVLDLTRKRTHGTKKILLVVLARESMLFQK